ncbi:MAG: protein kinase, partial [Phycisphaerales bacterium]|nr:protein kinase [Phycisphaerales bacterium]
MTEASRSGTRLGAYTLGELLGRGGMGEVYVATDDRLGRTVALKILRPDVVADAERRARFEREAKALAALKHPGIVTLHSLEDDDGVTFFTMDLVDGRPLSEIIAAEGAMSVDRILAIGIPVADALAAAHKRGIAHRDVKPDNIIVGPRGEITVLDFGLAKRGDGRNENTPTAMTATAIDVTVEGRIFGTVNYMAPEQAEGRETTVVTDVFALGVMFYEMATGCLPFDGDTAMSMISSILKDKPVRLIDHDREVPEELDRIIHRCLEKDPDRRWQTALDVRNELQILRADLARGSQSSVNETAAEADSSAVRSRPFGWMVATLLLAIAVGVLGVLAIQGPDATSGTAASTLVDGERIWTFDCLTTDAGVEVEPALSPNEEFIAFVMRSGTREDSSVYLLRVGGNRPIDLTPDMEGEERSPRFSPDGARIAFRSGNVGEAGAIYVMGATGEQRRRLEINGFAPDWSPAGDQLVCSTEGYTDPHGRPTAGGLVIVDIETGDATEIFAGDAVDPRWSPNGEWILFWSVGTVDEDGRFNITGRRDIGVVRADGSDFRLITDDLEFDWSPAWAENGRKIIFSSNRGGPIGLWELDFDPETGSTAARPRPLPAPSTYAGSIDVSKSGDAIVFVDGMGSNSLNRVRFDPETLESIGLPESVMSGGFSGNFDVSDDGERVVMSGGPMRSDDIYVSRGDGSGVRQVTDDSFRNLAPMFAHDPAQLLFFSNRSGDYEGWSCRVEGGGYRMLTDGWRLINTPAASPADGTLAFTTEENWYVVPPDPRGIRFEDVEPMPKIDESGRWFTPSDFSTDGRRLLGLVRDAGERHPLAIREIGIY